MPELISVLIPVYNGAATVREAISSIQRQSLDDFSIVIVDDGSTDATPEILGEIARQDARVHVLNKANGGVVEALNVGLELCQGQFLARHDADDLAQPERFARQIAYLECHPDCVAVGSDARHIDKRGRPTGSITRICSPDESDPEWVPSREPYLLHPFLMARRRALKGAGGYRHLLHSEDADLYWRLQEIGRLHHLNEILGDYRIHDQSVSSSSIHNGRVAALSAELAAISALRRRGGRLDLKFSKERAQRWAAAASLPMLFAIGCEDLDRWESDFLEIATAAKLLQFSFFRPYELETADIAFIAQAIGRLAGGLRRENRKELDQLLTGAAARLAHKGKVTQARMLLPPRLYPLAAAKLAGLVLRKMSAARRLLRGSNCSRAGSVGHRR